MYQKSQWQVLLLVLHNFSLLVLLFLILYYIQKINAEIKPFDSCICLCLLRRHMCLKCWLLFVPIVVAVPPMLHAKLTEKHNMARMFLSSSWLELDPLTSLLNFGSSGSSETERTSSRIASRIGIIMAQAAVLEIHLESNFINKFLSRPFQKVQPLMKNILSFKRSSFLDLSPKYLIGENNTWTARRKRAWIRGAGIWVKFRRCRGRREQSGDGGCNPQWR